AMRFDAGAGYVYAQTLDNIVVLHGGTPALEGKPLAAANEKGRLVTDLIRDALAHANAGVISYTFPKPGQTERQPKISYVERFPPWDLVLVSGAYVDDIQAALHGTVWRLGTITGAILSLALAVAWLVNRDISGSLGRLKTAMASLAGGDLATAVPSIDRRDE